MTVFSRSGHFGLVTLYATHQSWHCQLVVRNGHV